jgi:hypothetical protein
MADLGGGSFPPAASAEQDAPRYTARLLIGCADRPGIVAAVSGFLFEQGANIVSSHQYSSDPTGGRFFLRTEFFLDGLGDPSGPGRGPREGRDVDVVGARERFKERFDEQVGRGFEMDWEIRWWGERRRLAILVSRYDHCLLDLLWRWRRSELDAEIVAVISNHRDLEAETVAAGVPYHHVPVTKGNKEQAEAAMLDLLAGNAEVLVLARYMGGDARDQHPPLLPARLRRSGPLPSRARSGGQADRGHRPLRHRAARRRTDHRPGRRPRRSSPECPGPGARGSRRRAAGAGQGRRAAPG